MLLFFCLFSSLKGAAGDAKTGATVAQLPAASSAEQPSSTIPSSASSATPTSTTPAPAGDSSGAEAAAHPEKDDESDQPGRKEAELDKASEAASLPTEENKKAKGSPGSEKAAEDMSDKTHGKDSAEGRGLSLIHISEPTRLA